MGNHSVKAPLNIGVANAGGDSPPGLNISGLPVFTLECTDGPLNHQIFVVTDPGRALILARVLFLPRSFRGFHSVELSVCFSAKRQAEREPTVCFLR